MPKRSVVTPVGWIALGLSVLFVALLVVYGWTFGLALEYADNPHAPLVAVISPYLFLATVIDLVSAVALYILAGTRGWSNRIVGVIGGLILLTPLVLAAIEGAFP